MSLKEWRWGLAAVSGGAVASSLLGLVRLFLLFASDTAPRSTLRWMPVVMSSGVIASGIVGLVAVLFVAHAATGPALVRRLGGCLGATGVVVAVGGLSLLLFELFFGKPAIHPGRMPAGNVAGVAISLVVAYAGAGLLAMGLLVALAGLGWSWIRQRSGPAR